MCSSDLDTSKATEMSVSSIIGLTKAIEVSGGNAEKATQMFLNFSRTVGEAADGSRSAYDALDKLGISGAQLRTLNMDQLFALATKNLAEMGDAAKAAAAALPAMGRGAKGIDFGGVNENMAMFIAKAKEAEPAVNAAAAVMDNISIAIGSVKIAILQALKPLFDFINALGPGVLSNIAVGFTAIGEIGRAHV